MRKKSTWLALGAAAVLVGAAALAAVLAAGDSANGRAAHVALGSSGIAAESATHRTTGNFGPNVQTGTFDGVSPAVSDLPVLSVVPVTSVIAVASQTTVACVDGKEPSYGVFPATETLSLTPLCSKREHRSR